MHLTSIVWLLLAAALVRAAEDPRPRCEDNLCPETAPCCGRESRCGTGSECLIGCNPLTSFQPESCAPLPICRNATYALGDRSRYAHVYNYNGDSDAIHFVQLTGEAIFANDSIHLIHQQYRTATVISTTRFLWYGKITFQLKSSAYNGVVVAAITMSNTGDEMDFEFVGDQPGIGGAQENLFYNGAAQYGRGMTAFVSDDLSQDYHNYTIEWRPKEIVWSIDGVPKTRYGKEEKFLNGSNAYSFPQTPSMVQFSIWPGGEVEVADTRNWAGGRINYDTDEYRDKGYYSTQIKSLTIECYEPPLQSDELSEGQMARSYLYREAPFDKFIDPWSSLGYAVGPERPKRQRRLEVVRTDRGTILSNRSVTGLQAQTSIESRSGLFRDLLYEDARPFLGQVQAKVAQYAIPPLRASESSTLLVQGATLAFLGALPFVLFL